MQLTQLRNATVVIHIGAYNILVDPMLAPRHALPPLRLLDGQRLRNPLVDLPAGSDVGLKSVTHCLITHCQKGHFDHLDSFGKRWLRETQTPVICTPHDAPYLHKRGLRVQSLPDAHDLPQPFLDGRIRTVRCTHGRGLVGRWMEHGVGYFIEWPGEPSLYLAGDTVLTPDVKAFAQTHRPQVSVLPAGGARFDVGGDIIMGTDDVLEYIRLTDGLVIANHLEALSHCPVQRSALRQAAQAAGCGARILIPQDGDRFQLSDRE
jgi:L-ascorbate metabolism protein UlaG (beta-lactamase superfamily)